MPSASARDGATADDLVHGRQAQEPRDVVPGNDGQEVTSRAGVLPQQAMSAQQELNAAGVDERAVTQVEDHGPVTAPNGVNHGTLELVHVRDVDVAANLDHVRHLLGGGVGHSNFHDAPLGSSLRSGSPALPATVQAGGSALE